MARIVVGLTGSIATGKSTVARMFEELGAAHIDADKVAHGTYAKDGPAYPALVQYFGGDILTGTGEVDRKKLAQRVFNAPADLRKLEAIVWPAVNAAIADKLMTTPEGLVVIEAAKLIEAKRNGTALPHDYIVLVTATEDVQLERLMARDGCTREDALKRVRAQLSQAEKAKHAHYTINNSGTLDQTRQYVRFLYENVLKPQLS